MDRKNDMLKWSEEEITLLKQNLTGDINDVVKLFPDRTFNSVHVMWKRLRQKNKIKSALAKDTKKIKEKEQELDTSKKYKEALSHIDTLEKALGAYENTKNIRIKPIVRKSGGKKTHVTACALLSDVHAGAVVLPDTVLGLNEFNLEICERRLIHYFNNLSKLIKIHEQNVSVDEIILALLGDLIDGYIHEENVETNELSPVESIIWIEERLISGINFLLENTTQDITIPIVCGNHSRLTDKMRHANFTETSLETILAHNLLNYFKGNKRVRIIFNKSNVVFQSVYGKNIRFEHGHNIKFAGGVGGLTVPLIKAVMRDNMTVKSEFVVYGHFHNQFTAPSEGFMLNGCVKGYDKYALDHHFKYQDPQQLFFLIDEKGRVIQTTQIFLDE